MQSNKTLRSAIKSFVASVHSNFPELSSAEYTPEILHDQITLFKKSVYDIKSREIALSDMKIIEFLLKTRFYYSHIHELFMTDDEIERLEEEKRQQYQAELNEKIKDIRQGMSMEEFCDKYLAQCLQYYRLRDQYANP